MNPKLLQSQRIAIVRTSQKAGVVGNLWVYDERPNGWILAGPDRAYNPDQARSPMASAWYHPKHILRIVNLQAPDSEPFDWNGIPPGTLVETKTGELAVVIEQKGPKYTVLFTGEDNEPVDISWTSIVPVDPPSD